jgi:methylmalonyl-CoA mutase
LLKAIDLSKTEIVLHTASDPLVITEAFLNEVKRKGVHPSKIQGRLVFDPLAQLAVTGEKADEGISILARLIQLTAAYPEFRVLTINSTHLYDAGSSEIQELAFALNTAVEYIDQLTEKGVSTVEAVKNLSFSLAVGTNYFFEIAKLRALRVLFHQVTSLYGLESHPGDLKIHSVSAIWSKTIYDPYVNMLRNTTEAMAAIIGGCDSISIRPFDDIFQAPNAFSRRIARNISTMLKEESYFDKVVDPAAGSYYLETITDKLIENSWNLFLETEKAGGLSQALESGFITQKIEAVKKDKISRVANRRDILVGVNQYPNQTEMLDPDKIRLQQTTANGKTLKIERAAEAFEKLRLRTDKYVKQVGVEKRPTVFLSLIGDNAVMRKARASFSAGFLGCAGFKLEESSPSASLDEALAKAEAAKASIVVICGADEDYTSGDAATFASKLKATRKDTIVILAGYPAEHMDTLKAAGVDEFIHLKADLLGTLSRLQDKIGIR